MVEIDLISLVPPYIPDEMPGEVEKLNRQS